MVKRDRQILITADQCISRINYCDGKFDCEDKSDEDQCSCQIDQFTCADSTCISRKESLCDGNSDCLLGEDELGCESFCENRHFCDGRCLSDESICDGVNDCQDESDESDCNISVISEDDCLSNEFFCGNECIPQLWRCDGQSDCENSVDEKDCLQCPENMFECGDGRCIEYSKGNSSSDFRRVICCQSDSILC